MTGSRADGRSPARRGRAACAVLTGILLILGVPQTLAQSNGPVRIVPQALEEALDAPDPGTSGDTGASDRLTAPSGISVQPLNQVGQESIGILDAADGGLGSDMWAGTDRRLIDALIARIPRQPEDPAQIDLTRKLLLTRAAVPDSRGGSDGPPLVTVRARVLFDMGLVEDAAALAEAAPRLAADPAHQRVILDRHLLANDLPSACGLLAQIKPFNAELPPYWARTETVCKAVAGDRAGAEFDATILAETADADTTAFLALLDPLIGIDRPVPDNLGEITALKIAMIRTAGAALPLSIAEAPNPAFQRALVAAETTDTIDRIILGEGLAERGLIPPAEIAALYAALPFDANALSSALSLAAERGGASGRALLYQAAAAQQNTVARAELVIAALDLAASEGLTRTTAGVMAPLVAEIAPNRELWWFADHAARTLYTTGRFEAARQWAVLLRDSSFNNAEAEAAALSLWPTARLSGDTVLDRLSVSVGERWYEQRQQLAPETATAAAARLFTLIDALGGDTPRDVWADLILRSEPSNERTPGVAIARALGDAAEDGRQGAVVLLSLFMLGNDGAAAASARTLGDVVSALMTVGLEAEARALALNALQDSPG